MPKISFHGLCGFTHVGPDVRVLMPNASHHGKAHRATMLIDLDRIESNPDWDPNDVISGTRGKQFGIWELKGLDLDLRSGVSDGELVAFPGKLIKMAEFHKDLKLADLKGGVAILLLGGKLTAEKMYPKKLKVQKVSATDPNDEFKQYVEVVEWESGQRTISSRHGSITLKDDEDEIVITNTVPGFSPGHEGLQHFGGYYSILTLKGGDEQCELVVEAESETAIRSAGAGNCVPNVELP